MKRTLPAVIVFSLAAMILAGPGCALSELKNTNRRLKEANDRLVSENNRLEQELAASEKDAAEKAKKLQGMQDELAAAKAAPAPEPVPVATKGGKNGVALDADLESLRGEGIEVTRTSQGILMRLKEAVFFSAGKSVLSPKGQTILKTVASQLNSRYRGHLIRVEGHTDDVPVNKVKNQYPTNWELSTARACSVVRYLVDRGNLSPKRVYPAGFASYKPVTPAKTAAARSQNRRVEILILNERA
jgi:chemotaxis protein MotB